MEEVEKLEVKSEKMEGKNSARVDDGVSLLGF